MSGRPEDGEEREGAPRLDWEANADPIDCITIEADGLELRTLEHPSQDPQKNRHSLKANLKLNRYVVSARGGRLGLSLPWWSGGSGSWDTDDSTETARSAFSVVVSDGPSTASLAYFVWSGGGEWLPMSAATVGRCLHEDYLVSRYAYANGLPLGERAADEMLFGRSVYFAAPHDALPEMRLGVGDCVFIPFAVDLLGDDQEVESDIENVHVLEQFAFDCEDGHVRGEAAGDELHTWSFEDRTRHAADYSPDSSLRGSRGSAQQSSCEGLSACFFAKAPGACKVRWVWNAENGGHRGRDMNELCGEDEEKELGVYESLRTVKKKKKTKKSQNREMSRLADV